MVNWSLLQNATTPDNKPTPGWLFHEICRDVRGCPGDSPDVAEHLMQCVCSDQLNVQLKAVLVLKQLAAEVVTFQQYVQSCGGALKILEDIAAPPVVPQARSLESQEVKTVRDATRSALSAIRTPHTVERSTETASLRQRIQGFGNYEPPPEEEPPGRDHGVGGQVAEFVGDSIGDMVDDFREKGAVGALKDATIDALDLVLDGVDAVWSWMAGKSDDNVPRICQPAQQQVPGAFTFAGTPVAAGPTGLLPEGRGAAPQLAHPRSAPNHYAAAFGQGVVGANNPVLLAGAPGAGGAAAAGVAAATPSERSAAAPVVDLLSMDGPAAQPAAHATPAPAPDLLDDVSAPPPPQAAPSMLDF